MDAQSLDRAVYEWKEVLLRHDYAVAVWPEDLRMACVSQESGIWIRLWAPTIFSSDTFWAVVPEEIAMRILVLGELP